MKKKFYNKNQVYREKYALFYKLYWGFFPYGLRGIKKFFEIFN